MDQSKREIPPTLEKAWGFFNAWLVEYPAALTNNSKLVWLFGLRYQLAFFMVAMILVVCWSAYDAIRSTVTYTEQQKLSDLQDECDAAKNEIALLLQQGYAEALTQLPHIHAMGEKSTYKSNFFDSVELLSKPKTGDTTDWTDQNFDLPALPKYPRWSHFYWKDSLPPSTGTDLPVATDPQKRAFINLYLPDSAGAASILRFEVTTKFDNFVRSTRTLSLIANVTQVYEGGSSARSGISLALVPSGAPSPDDSPELLVEEDASTLAAVSRAAVAWERQNNHKFDKAVAAKGRDEITAMLYPPDGVKTLRSFTAAQLAGSKLMALGGNLYFSRGRVPYPDELDETGISHTNRTQFQQQFKNFEDRLKAFEQHVKRTIDPFAVILHFDKFREFRARASSPQSLNQLQKCIENELGLFATATSPMRKSIVDTHTQLNWVPTDLTNFKLAINKLVFSWPNQAVNREDKVARTEVVKTESATTNADQEASTQDICYLIRASSTNEIVASASSSISSLRYYIAILAIVVAVLTLVAATYLTRPLSKMESIAREIATHGFAPDQLAENRIQALLEQLPTGRRDEVGTLSKQFKETTLQVLHTNKALRDSKASAIAEQRRIEQAERNKAIADEVSQAFMLLLASVSHDMRQPLNPIFFYTEQLLQRPNLSVEEQRALSKILRSARGLSFLVEDILDYKRILAGDVVLNVEEVDIGTLLSDLKEDYTQMAQTKSTTIHLSNEWHGTLSSDENRLKRILNNLISNACKATQNGSINIRVVPYGIEHVELSVRDSGCGMDKALQRLLFEPPERQVELARQHSVRNTSRDPNSTRIGLFVCKQLIEAMGGTIHCTSEPGRGSEFVVRLPVRPPAPVVETTGFAQPAEQSQSRTTIAVTPGKYLGRAIVIDDDRRCTEILAHLLNGLGYDVEQIHDPRLGLERAIASPPDLITLDVYMPELDGWDLLRSLKENANTASTTVIMVTIDPDQEKATLLGANGFVNKPIDPTQFTTAVWQALKNRQGANVLVVDDDAECRRQLIEILKPLGCKIIEGVDGEDALQKLSEIGNQPLDLAIVDLYMPNMDGFTLIDQLRQKTQTQDARIIILSGGVLSDSERQKLFQQADQFFSKGTVSLTMLQQEIQNILVQQLQHASHDVGQPTGAKR